MIELCLGLCDRCRARSSRGGRLEWESDVSVHEKRKARKAFTNQSSPSSTTPPRPSPRPPLIFLKRLVRVPHRRSRSIPLGVRASRFVPFHKHVRRLTDKAARTGDENKGSFFDGWHFLLKWSLCFGWPGNTVDGKRSCIHRLGWSKGARVGLKRREPTVRVMSCSVT